MDLSEYFEEPAEGAGRQTPAQPRRSAPAQGSRRPAPAQGTRRPAAAASPARRPVREPEAQPRKGDKLLNIALLICGVLAIGVITFVLILLLSGKNDAGSGGQSPQGGVPVATASPQPIIVPPASTESVSPPNPASPTAAPVLIVTPTPLPTATPATPLPTVAPATPAPTVAPATPVPTAAPNADYLLPESNTRYLTEADLAGLTHEQLCFARNEIFARHGRIFKTPQIAAYFNSKPWYKGTIAPDKFDEKVFNKYESANVGFIRDYEKKYYGGSYY
jgi:hypothetical protein